ncbi:hypothetical protein EI94DRAFT_1785995 [Lactarius quietus]|nr:hypothetical protein EI94DRAFT_1785995 [Lactarius quietus]
MSSPTRGGVIGSMTKCIWADARMERRTCQRGFVRYLTRPSRVCGLKAARESVKKSRFSKLLPDSMLIGPTVQNTTKSVINEFVSLGKAKHSAQWVLLVEVRSSGERSTWLSHATCCKSRREVSVQAPRCLVDTIYDSPAMYNGIGLTTPRGSGTNGYVVRNLSVVRNRDPNDRANTWDAAPPKHREPDKEILEHERKRKVEVKCLELQLELEDKDFEEDEIERQVTALRERLLSMLPPPIAAKGLKPSDTHALAAAKKVELDRMAAAIGARSDYTEGDAFNKEKQEELRQKRVIEREERNQRREEERKRLSEQKEKWAQERREKERLRRREEDMKRRERRSRSPVRRDMPPPPTSPRRRRPSSRSLSPPPRRRRFDSRSPPPPRDHHPRRLSPDDVTHLLRVVLVLFHALHRAPHLVDSAEKGTGFLLHLAGAGQCLAHLHPVTTRLRRGVAPRACREADREVDHRRILAPVHSLREARLGDPCLLGQDRI